MMSDFKKFKNKLNGHKFHSKKADTPRSFYKKQERNISMKNRCVEINLDRQNNSLKIASIYTTKINEKEALRNWWNGLSQNWKTRLGSDVILDDSTTLAELNTSSLSDFSEFDAKLKLVIFFCCRDSRHDF